MPRRVRQLLVASLIALHGLAMLGGPALHALPGFVHAGTLGSGEGGGATGGLPDRDAKLHGDCPICHSTAQGQLLDDADIEPLIDVVQVLPPDDPPLAPPPALVLPSRPRAPPIA